MEHLSQSPLLEPWGRVEELGALAMLEWFLLASFEDFPLGMEWI
jgi:hypothetical protein